MSASFCVSDQRHYKNPNFHNHCLKGRTHAGLWECMNGYCCLSAQKVESTYTSWKIGNSFITSFLADVSFCLYSVPLCHLILPFNNRKLFNDNIIKYLIIVIIHYIINIWYSAVLTWPRLPCLLWSCSQYGLGSAAEGETWRACCSELAHHI